MSTTRVALVYPVPSVSSPQKSPPLSVLHVGEALKQAKARGKSDENYEVKYFDLRYDDITPEDFKWADVVGVSSMTGMQLKGAIWALKEAKRYGKRTILGGIHVSMQPEQCLSEDYVDSVVLSEGEWGVIQAIHGGHKERVHSHLAGTQDHVSPVSPETLLHFRRSARTGDTVLMTSRGCPFRCGFCLDGDTLVMMSDLTWRRIREIEVGSEVVGLEKSSYSYNISRSKVLATSHRIAETFEVMTDKGAVIATSEHPWLAGHNRWRKTENLRPGDRIRWLTQPIPAVQETDDYKTGYLAGATVGDGFIGRYHYPGTSRQSHFGIVGDDEMLDTFKEYAGDIGLRVIEGKFNGGKLYPNVTRKVRTNVHADVNRIEAIASSEIVSDEYKRGFLAGFYDADGSCDRNAVRFWNRDENVSMRLAGYLSEFGFRVTVEFSKGKHIGLLLLGGAAEKIRFFSLSRPSVEHKAPVFGVGMGDEFATVISVQSAGEREVFDIQTETENFIANGLVSHNCYIQQFFERSWQSVDLDRWKYDVLFLKANADVRKYEHGDDWIGKWSRAREIVQFLWTNGIEYRPSIRAHQIDDTVAREMHELGIKHISVGMETASERMLKLTQKDITREDQVRCAESLSKYGIWPLYYWITGFPTETPKEINETLDQADLIYHIHQGRLTQNFFAYTALPGSPLFDLVDEKTLPQSMSEWSNYSINKTLDKRASNLYHIGGLHFHRRPGDKTDRNFPGWRRLLIWPFEALASLRWKRRLFTHFGLEMLAIEALLKWASLRYERRIRKDIQLRLCDMQPADWGVRDGLTDIGARGEFLTGELGK